MAAALGASAESAMTGPVVPFALGLGPAARRPARPARRALREERAEREFTALGHVVVPFLESDEVSEALAVYQELGPPPDDPRSGFFAGNTSRSAAWKRQVLEALRPMIDAKVDAVFEDYSAYHLTFLVKWPGPDGRVEYHQDPTVVLDEAEGRAATIWCPLNPRPNDGGLRVASGSVHLPIGNWYRGRWHCRPSLIGVEEELAAVLDHSIDVASGQALVFDQRTIHGSPPSGSEGPRVVLAVGLCPSESQLVHVEQDLDGWVNVYAVDEESFVIDPSDGDFGDHYPRIARTRALRAPAVRREDLNPPAVVSPDNEGGAAADRFRAASLVGRTLSLLVGRGQRRVLADEKRDWQLRRDGFVKLPLLSRAAALDLRQVYGQMHGWQGTGFEVDFWSSDPDYRRAINEVMAAATDPALSRAFDSHRPFLRNFLVKWPGEPLGEFPQEPHRDWMYTDERSGVDSWVVWIALQDIDRDNGQIRFARGSHRIDQMTRGTNLVTPWLRHGEVWEDFMVTVPIRAGEAIVMSSAVVHCSFPNFSGDPRVVAAVAVSPAESGLLHYRRHDRTRAARYEVDTEFFVTSDPAGLIASPPDLAVADFADIGERDLDQRELARRLDRNPLAVLDRRRVARSRRAEATRS